MVGRSILIVDDNPASRVYLANFLKGKLFKVLEASNGKEGLIAAWRDAPDLILFDPTLGDIQDKEFIQKLHDDPRTGMVTLVALSGDPSPLRRQACLNAGVAEYLVKSSQAIVALEETLNRILSVENPTEPANKEGEKGGSLIVFLSAKGGTGTSSLCGRSLSRISLLLIQKADLIVLVVSTDQSTVKLTKTVWDYLKTQDVDNQKIYAILNRAVGLEGLTKTQTEEMIGLPIRTAMPYMGGNFALADNLNQPITVKYPTDTASIIFKSTAQDIVSLVHRWRAK